MKTKITVIGIIFSLVFFTACDHERIRVSDEISSLNYSIPNYSKLKVSHAFNVYVTFSDTEEQIRIEANANLHDRIVVKRDGNSLVIKLKEFTQVRGNATLNAYITTNSISDFDISGATNLNLENAWLIQDGTIDASGASKIRGEISAGRLEIDLSGASRADLYGASNSLNADLSGSSEIRDFDFSVERLHIDLSGASEAYLLVNESISVEASGASTLHYKGNAAITHKDLSGASELRNRN